MVLSDVNMELMHVSLYRQVDRDCEFLEQERIMDYSLLVGVHFRDTRNPHVPEGWYQILI